MQFDSAYSPVVSQARTQSIGDLPRRSAARFPDKLAIVHREIRLTFTQLDAVIDRVAAALHDAGLRRGDRLAVLSHNCWQLPVLNFATARLGIVFVPVNFMLTGPEIAYILDDCRADAFVVEDSLTPIAGQALAESAGTVRIKVGIELSDSPLPEGWTPISEWTDFRGEAAPHVSVGDDDVIRIMYTSGTESRPKGALLTSRSLMWQYISCIVTGGMETGDKEVHALPLYHCAQLDNFLSTDIYLGAPVSSSTDQTRSCCYTLLKKNRSPICSALRPYGSDCCIRRTSTPPIFGHCARVTTAPPPSPSRSCTR